MSWSKVSLQGLNPMTTTRHHKLYQKVALRQTTIPSGSQPCGGVRANYSNWSIQKRAEVIPPAPIIYRRLNTDLNQVLSCSMTL